MLDLFSKWKQYCPEAMEGNPPDPPEPWREFLPSGGGQGSGQGGGQGGGSGGVPPGQGGTPPGQGGTPPGQIEPSPGEGEDLDPEDDKDKDDDEPSDDDADDDTDDEPATGSAGESTDGSGGKTILLVILGLAVVGAIGFAVWKYQKGKTAVGTNQQISVSVETNILI